MIQSENSRWKQRFSNYQKALMTLTMAVKLAEKRPLSDLEKQGLIQGFEFTHELYWKTLKDFFKEKGTTDIYGSKDATREGFQNGLLQNGDIWMEMIESRNLSSHTYNNEISDEIVHKILTSYYQLFCDFESKMIELQA
jgi:nucleotidyltransferase substrate binding protein (TIGR01987 family)